MHSIKEESFDQYARDLRRTYLLALAQQQATGVTAQAEPDVLVSRQLAAAGGR